jgi:hypothetical protein
MNKLKTALLLATFCITTVVSMPAQANQALDYYDSLKAKNEERRKKWANSYNAEKNVSYYSNKFGLSKNSDAYKKNKKTERNETGLLDIYLAPKSQQWDTWGRNGGQHKNTVDILQNMMSPTGRKNDLYTIKED